jgi:phospholipid N-methyltransferase
MLQAFRKDFSHTGSLLPSSKGLSRELAANLRGERIPGRILEIGPGTGPVTEQILKSLQPGDQFDAVEINGDFVRLLCERFSLPGPASVNGPPERFRLFHIPIQRVPGAHCYDHLISGLPFNNFSARLTREIWRCIHRLAAPGATFAFFEYVAIRKLKMPFVSREEQKRLALIGRHLSKEIERFQFREKKVWANVPPAVVHHLRLNR